MVIEAADVGYYQRVNISGKCDSYSGLSQSGLTNGEVAISVFFSNILYHF